jgi:uncharacterized repeat protein (TIGR01451 family)
LAGDPRCVLRKGFGSNSWSPVGETWTWTASYTVKAADITGEGGSFTEGFLTNTADATAKFGETPVDVDPVTVNTPVFNPAFAVDKAVTSVTNGYLDGSTWIVNSIGDTINYTITVTNTGNVALTKDSIVDTLEATVGYPLSGPTGDNGVVGTLEVDEVWTFTAQHVVTAADFALSDDDIDNRIDAKFNFGNTQLTGSDSVETPIAKVDLEKGVATAVDGPYADADAPTGAEVGVAQDMYFKITITNTGAVDLDNVVVWDISTAHGNALNYLYQNNDLTVFAGSLGATIDKADGDNVLSVGETWTIKYVEDFEYGQHINTGYVTNDQGATDNDAAHYVGKEVGPGVRTPGFWSNWQALWDGDLATKPKQQGTDGFADHDLLFVNADGGPTGPGAGTNNGYEFLTTYGGQKGLLIGDWNKDGSVDADGADNVAGTPDDEDVLFIKLSDAQALINASSKQLDGKSGDGVMMLGRDVVATWLNYLAGNPIDKPGVEDDGYSPKHYIQDAVNWLKTFGDANNTTAAGPGNGYTYDPAEAFDTYSPSHAVIKTSTAYWSGNIVDGTHSAAEMHGELDFYNNTGAIHDEALLVHQYANPGG